MRGNSAVNIALWDIYGQALGEPVWRLLGGRTHESVPIYNTCAGYGHVRATKRNALFERTEDWSLKSGDMAEGPYEDLLALRFNAGELAKSLLGEGIRGMKIWPFDIAAEASNGTRISGKDMDKALEPFAKIRDAVGRDMEIMVELHGLWTLPLRDAHRRGAEALRRGLAGGADPLQRARRHGRARAPHLDPDRRQRTARHAADLQAADRQARRVDHHDRPRLVRRD